MNNGMKKEIEQLCEIAQELRESNNSFKSDFLLLKMVRQMISGQIGASLHSVVNREIRALNDCGEDLFEEEAKGVNFNSSI